MDNPTIDLASNEELATELMKRATFVGVLIRVSPEVKGAHPRPGDKVQITKSSKLSELDVARMLATAVRKTLDEIAKEK